MARREWAQKIIAKYERKDDWGIECVSSTEVQRLLLKEHARAVRIVKAQLKAAQLDQHTWLKNERDGYLSACRDILAMLQKGRA